MPAKADPPTRRPAVPTIRTSLVIADSPERVRELGVEPLQVRGDTVEVDLPDILFPALDTLDWVRSFEFADLWAAYTRMYISWTDSRDGELKLMVNIYRTPGESSTEGVAADDGIPLITVRGRGPRATRWATKEEFWQLIEEHGRDAIRPAPSYGELNHPFEQPLLDRVTMPDRVTMFGRVDGLDITDSSVIRVRWHRLGPPLETGGSHSTDSGTCVLALMSDGAFVFRLPASGCYDFTFSIESGVLSAASANTREIDVSNECLYDRGWIELSFGDGRGTTESESELADPLGGR
jgi:hypothetical protein